MKVAIRISCTLVLCFFLGMTLAQVDAREAAKFEPAEDKILPIIGQSCAAIGGVEGYASENSYYQQVVIQAPELMPAAITLYGSLKFDDSDRPILSFISNQDPAENCLLLFKDSVRYRNTALHLSLSIKNVNADVAAGLFDEAIILLADYIRELDRPVYLRIGYEFDNPGHGNPDGEMYQQAFRRIVDVIHEQQVDNFATVFASTLKVQIPFLTPSFNEYYPGDTYVDWVGFSFWGGPLLNVSLSNDMMSFARERGKPVMIGESAPMFARFNNAFMNRLGLNNLWMASFFKPYFNFINKHSDTVKAFHYISEDWSLLNHIWRSNIVYFPFVDMNTQLHKQEDILQFWINEISKEQYLKVDEGSVISP